MDLYSRGAFGEPEQKTETTSAGDVVGTWVPENLPNELARVIGLKVIFRHSFSDFRSEVERAAKRWIEPARHARDLVAAREGHLKRLHKQMLDEKVPEKALVRLVGTFFIRCRVALGVLLTSGFCLSGDGGSAFKIIAAPFAKSKIYSRCAFGHLDSMKAKVMKGDKMSHDKLEPS